MAEELKEDKLIIKKDNIVKKGARDGWELIKIIWLFLKEELPRFLSNWRTVPRIMMALCNSFLQYYAMVHGIT